MSAVDILASLQVEGITLSRIGEQLRVQKKTGKLTDEQKALLIAHKPDLLRLLNTSIDAQNSGSLEALEPPTMVAQHEPQTVLPEANAPFFKTYKLPEGETLQLTKEEFEQYVDVIRLLLKQDVKLKQREV